MFGARHDFYTGIRRSDYCSASGVRCYRDRAGRGGIALYRVSDRTVALQSPLIHPGKRRHAGVNVIVNLDDAFVVVKAVQPAYILLERPFPGHRHCQKQSVQARIVESLADVTPVARIALGSRSGTDATASATALRCFLPIPPFKTNACLMTPSSLAAKNLRCSVRPVSSSCAGVRLTCNAWRMPCRMRDRSC